MEAQCDAAVLSAFDMISGHGVFPLTLSAETAAMLNEAELQLPCARIDRPDGIAGDQLDAVLQEEKIELRELRVKYPRDSFFSKGMRKAMIRPTGLTCKVEGDELHDNRQKLTLSFALPRGSYATILVKRITEVQ